MSGMADLLSAGKEAVCSAANPLCATSKKNARISPRIVIPITVTLMLIYTTRSVRKACDRGYYIKGESHENHS